MSTKIRNQTFFQNINFGENHSVIKFSFLFSNCCFCNFSVKGSVREVQISRLRYRFLSHRKIYLLQRFSAFINSSHLKSSKKGQKKNRLFLYIRDSSTQFLTESGILYKIWPSKCVFEMTGFI